MSEVEEIYVTLGSEIMTRRLMANLTHEALGKAVGLSRTSAINIEAGRQRVLPHQVVAFADALGADAGEFLGIVLVKQPRDVVKARARIAELERENAELRREMSKILASVKSIRRLTEFFAS